MQLERIAVRKGRRNSVIDLEELGEDGGQRTGGPHSRIEAQSHFDRMAAAGEQRGQARLEMKIATRTRSTRVWNQKF